MTFLLLQQRHLQQLAINSHSHHTTPKTTTEQEKRLHDDGEGSNGVGKGNTILVTESFYCLSPLIIINSNKGKKRASCVDGYVMYILVLSNGSKSSVRKLDTVIALLPFHFFL